MTFLSEAPHYRISWLESNGETRWEFRDEAEGLWGWCPHLDTDIQEDLYLFPGGAWVLECCKLRRGDWDKGEEEYVWDCSVRRLSDNEALTWLFEHEQVPANQEPPAVLISLFEKYRGPASKTPTVPPVGVIATPPECETAPAEMVNADQLDRHQAVSSTEKNGEGDNHRSRSKSQAASGANGTKAPRQKRWTQPQADEAIRRYFEENKEVYDGFFKRIREGLSVDAATRRAVREVFGRNTVAETLGMSTGTVSKSPEWKERARLLGITGESNKP
jgi:hypothetical protein